MESVELERLVQKVTDQVIAELNSSRAIIEFNDRQELYPTWFWKMTSADFNCQFNAKQDSNAVLLCLSKLSLNEMLAISNLVGINSRCKKVLDFILKGLPVWVVGDEGDYLKGKGKQKYAVYHKILNSINEIQNYGIQFISTKEELEKNISVVKKQRKVTIPKRFVTLGEVQKRAHKGMRLLNDFEVPTDLAKEWMAKRGDKHEY